jgi:hypothetical protein
MRHFGTLARCSQNGVLFDFKQGRDEMTETKKEVVGIKQTSRDYDVWRLTFDGTILGDSRGYRRDQAICEARKQVALHDDRYELDATLA